jgi:hypothetical protein
MHLEQGGLPPSKAAAAAAAAAVLATLKGHHKLLLFLSLNLLLLLLEWYSTVLRQASWTPTATSLHLSFGQLVAISSFRREW